MIVIRMYTHIHIYINTYIHTYIQQQNDDDSSYEKIAHPWYRLNHQKEFPSGSPTKNVSLCLDMPDQPQRMVASCNTSTVYQYLLTLTTYRFAPPRLLDDAMRARGNPRIATRPPMKDAPAATAKAGAFPPPKSWSHGPLPSDTITCR
jgi:hypothetical protein